MKIKILLLLIISQPIYSQNESEKINLKGTSILVEKPNEFNVAEDFIGFKKDSSLIQFNEIYGVNYNKNHENFDAEKLAKGKLVLVEKLEFKVDQFPANLIHLKGEDRDLMLMAFGNDKFTVFITAYLKQSELKLINSVKKSLLDIEYLIDKRISPYERSYFSVDDSNSSYKFFKISFGNIFRYTKNGKWIDNFEPQLQEYTITQSKLTSEIKTPKQLMEKEYPTSFFDYFRLETSEKFIKERNKLNSYDCYEEVRIGELDGNIVRFSLISVINKNKGIVILSYASIEDEVTLNEFELITNTLQLK